jgi:hypothetical protein
MAKPDGIDDVKALLVKIYGENKGNQAFNRIKPKIEAFPVKKVQAEDITPRKMWS